MMAARETFLYKRSSFESFQYGPITKNLLRYVDESNIAVFVFIGHSKSFDTVNHDKFLGFRGTYNKINVHLLA